MSYKDGIPLLKPFEDENEDDDEDFLIEPRLHRVRCRKKHVCFGLLLFLAVVVIAGVAAGIAVPIVLLRPGGNTSGVQGANQTENSSLIMTEMPTMSMSLSSPPMSSPTPVMSHSSSVVLPNPTTSHSMAHSGSILSRSSFKPSQSSQGSPTSAQMRTTSTTTQGMTMHTTQVPTPTNSTIKTIVTTSVHTMASSTPLMTTSTASVPMMTPSMTMANGNVPKATSSVSVTKKSTPTMTQHSFPVSTMAPSTPMMMRSTSMAQPSSIIPSSFPMNQSTPVMISSAPTMTQLGSPIPTMTPSTPMMMRSTSMAQPSSIIPSSFPMNQSTPVMISSAPTMIQLGSPVPTMTPSLSIATPSITMANQTHSSVAMTIQLSSHGILPTHSSPAPTATESLVPTPAVSSQMQMVSTVMPTPTPSPTPGAVGKSAMDHRTYQVLSLGNELRVLLISDPNTSISAAAMDVAVGSFSDPPEVQGLAHFCEHMLFLGTMKYPEEDAYSSFLSTHGGYDNAFTSTQETNYYFSVQADYLEQALDRFAQFFIAPLFSPGAVSKESHAVNAEYEKNLQSDGHRLWQLLRHVSNPSHPFSMFSTGNLETLNNSNILEYLHNYYNSHYSANQMQLVIYGKDPIENLTMWADEYFSPIINLNVSAPTFNTTSFPLEYSGKIVFYYPVANRDTLHIYWQTPPLQDKYRNVVSQFLTRYLGHEGEGSILWKLRTDTGLASSLTAGTELNTDSYTLLYVSIDVTSDGLSRLSEIVSIVFQYVRYLTSHFGEQEWEDFVNVSQLNFDYAEKAKPEDYVVTISEAMRLVTDQADFLGTPYRFVSNFSLVNDTLNYLTPENSVIFVGSQKLNFSDSSHSPVPQQGTEPVPWPSELTEFEPIYGTPYHKTNLSSSLIHYWKNGNNATSSFHLPGNNQFFPQDLSLLKAPENASNVPVETPIDNYPGVSLWWLQDTEFREPRVYLHCDLNTSNAESTAAWTAKSQLFVNLVDQLLESQVYAAEEVGYSYSLSASPHGLTLRFSGLSDPVTFGKFINLITSVLANIGKQSESSKLFTLAKDDETDYLMNYNLTTLPYQYYRYLQSVVLERPYWRHWELLSEVKKLGLEEIVSFANNLLSNITFLCFAHGNVDQSKALNYTHTLVAPLSSKLIQTHPVGQFMRRRVKLSSGTNYSVVIPALNPEDVNSVVNVLFQVGSVCHLVQSEEPGSHACSVDSLRTSVLLGLLNQIMEDQCFYRLRTIQQLGYVAFCHNRVNEGVGSFEVVVQSQEYEPGDVLERIDGFVESFEDYLSINMTEEEWETQVEVYRNTLQRRDTNLADKSSRLWGQISVGQLQFDYNAEAAGVLDTLNATTLLDFYYHNMVDRESYKKMVIVAYGRGKSGNLPYIDNRLDYTQLNFLPIPTTCPSGTVCKSAMDHRTYQVLSLGNELRVLLISDPNTSISAAAMDVAVGSFSDPPEVQGLAHFCEHMLFLGTQKYPEEDAYSNFLSTHGGYDNAFTSTQETNYYFSVQADYLEQALDRFAQFFIAPLFSPGAVSKESHAVNAEHEKNLQSDGWRLWQLLKHVSNPSHPFSMFATGNLETLNNSNILEYLHNYYDSHYSANQMQLVIYGRDPIENLTSWAYEYFSPINNSNVSAPTFNTTSFPPKYSGKIVFYYPVANRDTLHIYWQTPPLQDKYRNAVSQFLTRYLGHEGEGSILWKLRTDSGLATSLTAGTELGTELDTDSYTLLFVSIDVTSDGLSRLSEIVSIVFQYVRYLTSHFGEQEWEDFVNVSQLNFDYAKKAKAEDYVVKISEAMRLVTDPADFLGTPYRFVSNFSLVNDTLNYLTPENSVIFIGSQKLNFSDSSYLPVSQQGPEPVPWPGELTEFEPIYGTPYHKTNLSSSLIHYWSTDNSATSYFHLPGSNQFFPKDLSLLKAPDNVSKVPVEIPIDNYPGVSLWWLQDTEFREPRVYLHCDLNTSNAESTAAWTAKSQLFVNLVDQLLKSQVYAAEEVGYSYSLSASPHGLTLSFSGLSDPVTFGKFINLITSVLANIGKQSESSKIFILAKDDETDYLMNYNVTTLPYQYYQYIQSVVLERPYWRHWELLSEVKKLGLEQIVSFANNLLSNVTFLCFAHGNVNQSKATNYTHTLVSPLSSKLIQTHPVGHFWRRRVKLSSGTNYSVVIPALNPEDVNSVVNVLFQVGSVCRLVQSENPGSHVCSVDSLRTSVLLGLLNQIMENQCFYQLRTIQQLGYVAFCRNRVNEGVGSFEVVVQSQEYEPGDVLERIDGFVESFEDYLSINMTEAEWETQVEVYRDTLQRRDTNLAGKSSRLWGQISVGQLQFDYNAEAAGVLDTLNATTLLDFYHHNMVDRESYKKMVIVAYGRGKSGNLPYIDIPIDYTKLSFLPIPCPNGTVCKSAMDHRTYQVLSLGNKLRVLLISDPNTSISAAAMDVAVGSFSDPPEVQGLAHFCEHMLFLGTQKYPDEDAYSNFLSTHGGYDNAFTSTQETNYYFSVQADYLEQALDRFAQFFIAPLFSPGAVSKESHAVNAEHEKNLQSDEWRLWQLLKHVSNPSHPFSMFATGNLETLNNSNILEYLHHYYNSHYSANQMQLVIYGRDPIENLTSWADEYFSPINNSNVSSPTFNTTSFPPEYSGKIVFYYPVANRDTLHIYWQTPPLQDKYRNVVSQFLTRYLGHEGEGSILWKLRTDSALASSLTAGTELDTDSYTLLYVSIDVTSDGLSHLSEIISIVFQYVRLLKSNIGMQEWEDFVNVSQLNFDYAEKAEAKDYVVTISEAMRLVTDPADFLGTPYRFVSNFSLVNDTLINYLTPENSVIFIGSQKLNFNGSSRSPVQQRDPEPVHWPTMLTEFEPIYGTPYHKTNLSSSLMDYWRNDNDATSSFHLPGSNQFFPKDLSLLKAPENASNVPVETPIDNYPGVSLWWLQDTEFREPRVYLHCDLNTPNAENTAAWTAKSQLFVNLVDQLLESQVYAAEEVGYSYSLSASPHGLTLRFSGLSDPVTFGKFINLVTSVLGHITKQSERYKIFILAEDSETDYLMNYNLTTLPYQYYRYIQSVVLERPYWRHWELLSEVKKLGLEEIEPFANNLLSNINLLCFAHGNVNQSKAANYTHTLVSSLSSKLTQTHPVGQFMRRRVKLSSGTNYSAVIPALNPEDVNSVVNVLFQVGSVCHLVQSENPGSHACSIDSLRTSVLLGLLNQIMEDQCFYQLRTIQQLGYVAFCHNRVNEGVGSFEVVVQSQEYEPGDVLERIDGFVESFENYLSINMTEEEWETQVEVYRDTLQRRDTNLAGKSSRLWGQIKTGQLQFDYNAEATGVFNTLNFHTLLDFYHHNMVDRESYKKMVIVAYGRGKSGNLTYIDNPLDYTQLNFPPIPTTCENGTVNKSAIDHRTYQVLCLENQLRVLLISDPNTNISAAAMDVAVGSFSDPPEVQGLAHFCEHMLFLGTQKYPDEDAYSSFLSTHGGYDNAFTSTQETNYYFSVQADYLEQALDRFAQFFIAPLFSPGAVSKESHAVNAEHEKNLQSDEWRLWQLLKHISNPSHPFSRFATGNLETLNNPDILNYLHNYYTSHYSANQMQLVIYGRDLIENLTLWADEYFSPIINRNISTPTFDTTSFPLEYRGKFVYYYPVANRDTLHIYWQTPPLQDKYRNAVSQFLTRYLGHEGKGSILWKLRTDSGLASSLTAGIELDTDSYTLLFVSIDVTSDGLSRLSEIISIVFQYVRLLKSNLGKQEWEDFVRVHQLNFDYAEKAKAEDYVVTISEAMRLVTDAGDFLGTPYRFVSNFSLVNDTLNYLTPEHSVIFIGSQKLNFNGSNLPNVQQQGPEPVPWPSELTKYEPIYGTPYHKTNLSSSLIHYWRFDGGAARSLHLPGTNQYFPENLEVLKAPDNASKVPVEIPIENYPGVSLWWLQDTEFCEPRVYLHCDLKTSNTENTAAWTAKSQLFVNLVDQLLESQVYAAEEVGYSYSLSASPHGLTLRFSGLSDPVIFGKFINLVTGVLSHINDQTERYELYDLAKDDETDYLLNYNLTTLPYQYYQYIQSVVLKQPYWRHWELLSEVKKLGLDEIVLFANNLLSNVTFLCFAHGNVNQSKALNYTHTLVAPLSSKLTQTHPVGQFMRRRVKLSSGTNYSVVIPALNPEDVNSVVNVLFQVGSVCHLANLNEDGSRVCSVDSLKTSVLLGLLNQIMKDQCFYQLRTIQQLGYAVFCHNRVNEGVGSFEVVVQSQEYEPKDVLERIDSFVESFNVNVMEEEWETQVQVYRDTLRRRDTNLADKSSRLWRQISNGQLQFDYNAEAAGVLDTLNATTLLDFYHHNMVDRESYKKMVIVAYGRGKTGNLTYIINPLDYTQLSFTEVYDPL